MIIQYILIGSLFELSTVVAGISCYENKFGKIVNKLLKKEYRVKDGKSKEFINLVNEKIEKHDLRFETNKLFIPIYNIFYSRKKTKECIEECLDVIRNNDLVDKQTGMEKIEIWKIKDDYERVNWLLKEKKDRLEIIELERELVFIDKDELMYKPMEKKYNIVEVEALSDTYEYGYRLGILNNEPTAIIGVYNVDKNFQYIKTIEDSNYYELKPIDKDDIKKYEYRVYQYTLPHNIDKFNRCLDNIEKVRQILIGDVNQPEGDYIKEKIIKKVK